MFRRSLALVVVLAASIGFYLNGASFEYAISSPPSPILVVTQAKDLTLVCPGAVFQAGGNSGTSLNVGRVGSATLSGRFASQPGLLLQEQRLNGVLGVTTGKVNDTLTAASALTVVDQTGKAIQGSAMLSGVQVQKVAAPNLSGLAAANCVRPSSDSWLVGGSTSPGRETLVVLSNPTGVDSTVNLELIGTGGTVAAPGLSSISVPKLKTAVIPISGLAPNLSTFAVHVVSSGGALGTWLETRTIRGLTPGGVDFVGPSADPAKSLSIPGIFIRGSVDAAKLIRLNDAYSDLVPMLRITSTSTKDATVTAQFLGSSAKTFGTVVQQVVAANSSLDIPITGLVDGNYVAFINSSQPIRASIRLSRTKGAQTDFAWAPAVAALARAVAFNAPAGAISKLSIANPGRTPAVVNVGASNYTIPPSTAITVSVPAGAGSQISSNVPVSASLVIDVGGLISVVPVIDYKNLGGQLSVLVR